MPKVPQLPNNGELMYRLPVSDEPVPVVPKNTPPVEIDPGDQPKASKPAAKRSKIVSPPAPVKKRAKKKKAVRKESSSVGTKRCSWCGHWLQGVGITIHPHCEKIKARVAAEREERNGTRDDTSRA